MITTEGLTKIFGEIVAVSGLDLQVGPGETYALLGPLGCGNSSVIKMLATIVPPTRGRAYVAGRDIRNNPDAVRQVVGYMPDVLGAYDDMRVADCLRFYGRGHLLDNAQVEARVQQLLECCELADAADTLVQELGREQRRQLGLARALLHDPTVLLLDKPVAGLDLDARRRFFEIVNRACDSGPEGRRTLLLSSNLLSDATICCGRAGVMLKGQMMVEGTAEEIVHRLSPHRVFEVEVTQNAPKVVTWLRSRVGVRHTDSHGGFVVFTANHKIDPPELIRQLGMAGFEVRRWREHEIDFESLTPATEALV